MTNENKTCENGTCEIKTEEAKETNESKLPQLVVEEWLNTNGQDIKLKDLLGKVVIIEAFQMLCPGCVNHSLPQASKLHAIFRDETQVCVLGLHSVFEHHEAMTKPSLKAFLSEFRYSFPVAIDKHKEGNPVPETMKNFGLNGTPSLIIIDKKGQLKEIIFGAVDDLLLGLKIGKLLNE